MSSVIEALRPVYVRLAGRPAFARRLERLHEDLRALDPARAYVGFSAGKDSSVLAHAAHTVHPGIPIRMIDPGCPTHWLETERTAWLAYAAAQRWDLVLIPWDKWAAVAGTQDAAAHRAAAHADMFVDLNGWALREGRTHCLMGLRAAESKGRRASLATHGESYTARTGRTRVCPLGRWSTDEVWAYIITRELPWLSIYDHLGPDARNGLIGRNGLEYGRMAFLRRYYPAAWRHARDVLELDYARN